MTTFFETNTLKRLISRTGGIKKFSNKYDIPYRTVQNWNNGTSTPPEWLITLLSKVDSLEIDDVTKEQEGLHMYEDENTVVLERNDVDRMAELLDSIPLY